VRLERTTSGSGGQRSEDIKDLDTNTYDKDRKTSANHSANLLQKNPELENIISAWPELPEHIKAAIKTLIQAHKGEKK